MINKIELIAETPRAGRWNHRFLAAPYSELSEKEITALISAARDNAEGENYLAVRRQVAQTGGRIGTEILLLAGVDTKQLSDKQRANIMTDLEKYSAELDTLVTSQIEWETAGRQVVVKQACFSDWQVGFDKLNLPAFTKKEIPEKRIVPVQRYVMYGVLVVVLASMLFFQDKIASSWQSTTSTQTITDTQTTTGIQTTAGTQTATGTQTVIATAPATKNIFADFCNSEDDQLKKGDIYKAVCLDEYRNKDTYVKYDDLDSSAYIEYATELKIFFEKSKSNEDIKKMIEEFSASKGLEATFSNPNTGTVMFIKEKQK